MEFFFFNLSSYFYEKIKPNVTSGPHRIHSFVRSFIEAVEIYKYSVHCPVHFSLRQPFLFPFFYYGSSISGVTPTTITIPIVITPSIIISSSIFVDVIFRCNSFSLLNSLHFILRTSPPLLPTDLSSSSLTIPCPIALFAGHSPESERIDVCLGGV